MADREPYPSEQADKFLLRLPDGMRDEIAMAAKANGRSMNAEIVARLDRSFRGARTSRDGGPSMDEILTSIRRILDGDLSDFPSAAGRTDRKLTRKRRA